MRGSAVLLRQAGTTLPGNKSRTLFTRVPSVPQDQQSFILSTGIFQCCIENSMDGAVEELGYTFPGSSECRGNGLGAVRR